MKTQNGHDVEIDNRNGRVVGCRRCTAASMVFPSETNDQAIARFSTSICAPTQITLDRERGKHECPGVVKAGNDTEITRLDSRGCGGWVLFVDGDHDYFAVIEFCPFCGIKL